VTAHSNAVDDPPSAKETLPAEDNHYQSFTKPSEEALKTVTEFAMATGEASRSHTVSSGDNENLALAEATASENDRTRPRPLVWAGGEGSMEHRGFGSKARPFHSNKQRFEEVTTARENQVRKRQTSLSSTPPLLSHRSGGDVMDIVKASRRGQHPSDLSITLPNRMKALDEEEMKAVIQVRCDYLVLSTASPYKVFKACTNMLSANIRQ